MQEYQIKKKQTITMENVKGYTNEAVGAVKEGVGKATNDRSLEAEGHKDQAKGNLKQAGEKVKDAFKS